MASAVRWLLAILPCLAAGALLVIGPNELSDGRIATGVLALTGAAWILVPISLSLLRRYTRVPLPPFFPTYVIWVEGQWKRMGHEQAEAEWSQLQIGARLISAWDNRSIPQMRRFIIEDPFGKRHVLVTRQEPGLYVDYAVGPVWVFTTKPPRELTSDEEPESAAVD